MEMVERWVKVNPLLIKKEKTQRKPQRITVSPTFSFFQPIHHLPPSHNPFFFSLISVRRKKGLVAVDNGGGSSFLSPAIFSLPSNFHH